MLTTLLLMVLSFLVGAGLILMWDTLDERRIEYLWENYTPTGRVFKREKKDRKEYKPEAKVERMLNSLIESYSFKTAGVIFTQKSVINAVVSQSRVVWIQTTRTGEFMQVFVSVDENDESRLIDAVLNKTNEKDIATAKESFNTVLKRLRVTKEKAMITESELFDVISSMELELASGLADFIRVHGV